MAAEKEPRLTLDQHARLSALRDELAEHDAEAERKRQAILEQMGLAAADIHDDHPAYTKGLNAEIAAALGVSRNHVYRLIELATSTRKPRRAPVRRTRTTSPTFQPPE
jgi:hypothetical protein